MARRQVCRCASFAAMAEKPTLYVWSGSSSSRRSVARDVQDVCGVGGDAALEHLVVGALDGLEAGALLDLQPARRPVAEAVPRLGDALAEAGAAPVRRALGGAVGREE